MGTDALTTTTEQIRELMTRRFRPLPELSAIFEVTEAMDTEMATAVLRQLIVRRFLDRASADLAQMLSAKLGVEVQWAHMQLTPGAEWQEGRGE